MKTIIIGDLHGSFIWKQIIENEKPNKCIFIGDYFDSFEFSAAEQIYNFERIIEWKLSNPDIEVIMLIGNHDYHYFEGVPHGKTTGFQTKNYYSILTAIEENKNHLQMAYMFDNIICSHAGIGLTWLEDNGWKSDDDIVEFVNNMWYHKPISFVFSGKNPYGDDIGQTPIWIRPKSLMKDWPTEFRKKYIQVVGHTQQNQIDIKGKSTGNRFYFIDTLTTSGEYLIVENNTITKNSCKVQLNHK
jgi:hypothetical protein